MKQHIRRLFCGLGLLAGLGLLQEPAVSAEAPPALAHGINITHWFRFPPSKAARSMAADLDDAALLSLKNAGFTYVRLAVGPEEVMQGRHIAPDKLAALTAVIGRIEHAGLAVMVEPHPELVQNWNLQRNAEARERLFGFWRDLGPALRAFPVSLTFPELVNEPSLDTAAAWDPLQAQLLALVRQSLPDNTVILTGTNWSSIDGLLKVQPVADRHVIYSFHTYEPQLLTLLGFWDPSIKADQLAQFLPFPVKDQAKCKSIVSGIRDAHTLAMAQYWCSLHQDDASIAKNLTRASAWGRAHQVTVIMSEFGAAARLNAQARLAYLRAVRQSAEQLHLTWALWGLDDQMGFSQAPGGFHGGGQLSPSVLQALGLNPSGGT